MPTPKGAWTVTSLLFLYMMINFADKAVVGLAAVPIMRELDLTPKQYGALGSSFFLLFSLSGVLVGFQANRRPTRWIILLLAASWAVVQFPMIGGGEFHRHCWFAACCWASARARQRPSPCMPSTNGFPTRSGRCRLRSCRKAPRSA